MYENEKDKEGKLICSWCDEAVLSDQPFAVVDNEKMHIGCAVEEEEDSTFDRDMEFGC